MSLRSLREELESRQVFKAWEIEENLDRYFCRPVAVLFTAAFLPLKITPNQVSVGGMLIGMASAFFLFGPSYAALVLAVVLLWTSEVLDAADGQLARLSTRPSRYGRIIDGMCSMALFLTIYTVLGIGLYLDTGDWTYPLLALAALFAHSFQSSLYDFYRTEYIRVVKKREAADEDSLQALERAQRDEAAGQSLGKRLMLGLYKSYARRLARTTPTYQPLKMAIEERFQGGQVSESFAARYGHEQRKMVRWWNYLGSNLHLVALSASILSRRPEAYLWITAVGFSAYAIILTAIQRGPSGRLLTELRAESPTPDPAHAGRPTMAGVR